MASVMSRSQKGFIAGSFQPTSKSQAYKVARNFRDMILKHCEEIGLDAAQVAIDALGNAEELFSVFRRQALKASKIISFFVKVDDCNRDSEKVLVAAGRKVGGDEFIIREMPRDCKDAVPRLFDGTTEVIFIQGGEDVKDYASLISHCDSLGLVLSDPFSHVAACKANRFFADTFASQSLWKNKAGDWCACLLGHDTALNESRADVDLHGHFGFGPNYWYACRRKKVATQ